MAPRVNKGKGGFMNSTDQWSMGQILSTSSGYWRSGTIHAGVRLGVFSVLGSGACSASDVAAAVGGDSRGVETLLLALAAMGLLEHDGTSFRNTEAARDFLDRASERYIGHIILHHHHLVDGWARLHEAVLDGRPLEMRSYGEEHERESFLMGMFNLANAIAPRVAAEADLAGCRHLLDLGAGPGTYAIHFCLANPELRATIFDRPTTRPYAARTVERFGLSERISFLAGDFNADPLGSGYDAAWLSHILHSSGPESCRRLLEKTVAALSPGGLVMVHEFFLNDAKDGPEFPALFSLNMLLNNEEGRSYSEAEIRLMLQEAGVGEIHRLDFQGPNDSYVLCGRTARR